MTQKLNLTHPELTLGQLGVQLLLSQNTKHQPQVFYILLLSSRIDKDVVYEDYEKLI